MKKLLFFIILISFLSCQKESKNIIDTSEQTLIIVAEAIEHKFNKTELKTTV